MNTGQIIVIALSLALALWFLAFTLYNRRRARQTWRWLEPGLDAFGGRATPEWLGSFGAGLRVAIDNPRAPLRHVELAVRLESRENLLWWLFEHIQGRRDQLTLQVWLRSPARGEIEVVPVGSALDRALQGQADHAWQRTDLSPQWLIAHRGNVSESQIQALGEFVLACGRRLQRFSQRRSKPHLCVQLALSGLTDEPSQQLLTRVKTIITA